MEVAAHAANDPPGMIQVKLRVDDSELEKAIAEFERRITKAAVSDREVTITGLFT